MAYLSLPGVAFATVSAWLKRTGWTAILAFCLGLTLMIAVDATLDDGTNLNETSRTTAM